MSLTVLPTTPVQGLIHAAQHIQRLMNDGIIGAAFCGEEPQHVQETVAAFDRLNEAASTLQTESKIASPFIRFRREILGDYETAEQLRDLVIHLYSGGTTPANLARLLQHADERHQRIAMECIASYAQYGENDTFFMSLAAEIAEAVINAPVEVAA
jgi:hypothetical protein